MPPNVDVHTWRRIQIQRYIDKYNCYKPKLVLDWINSQHPNPYPQCNMKAIYNKISIIKTSSSNPPESQAHSLT